MKYVEFHNKSVSIVRHNDRGNNELYQDYLKRMFSRLKNLIHDLDTSDLDLTNFDVEGYASPIDLYDKVCDGIMLTLGHYLDGNVTAAYNEFERTMRPYKEYLFGSSSHGASAQVKAGYILYRWRSGELGKKFEKAEMLNIPRKYRHRIASQRFGLDGISSGYFASDSFVCWTELREPSFDFCTCSAFKLKFDIKLIELIIPSESPYSNPRDQIKFISSLPLLIAVSVPVLHDEGAFKEEYVIPRLLTDYVKSRDDIKGILYNSSRIRYDLNEPWKYFNLVIPCSNDDTLNTLFEQSNPLNLSLFFAAGLNAIPQSIPLYDNEKYLYLNKDEFFSYDNTNWGIIDRYLRKQIDPDFGL